MFDYWLIPTFVGNWMFGPKVQDEKIIELVNEVRPGGEYNYKIKRAGKEINHRGEFKVIDRPNRLEFNWQEGNSNSSPTNVQVQFLQDNASTKLKIALHVDPSLSESADTIKETWSRRCVALASLLSK